MKKLHLLATVALLAGLSATTSVTALGQKLPLHIPKIESANEAYKAYARSKGYQAILTKKYSSITNWKHIKSAVFFSPWCRMSLVKGFNREIILHYDSHGKVGAKYGVDKRFLTSKAKLKYCGAPYDVSVLKQTLSFEKSHGRVEISWGDMF